MYEGRTPNPLSRLSLDSGSTWGKVEDAFFERGVEEEREAMALYAKLPAGALKEPRRFPVQPKYLFWAGCAAILIVASVVIVPRLMGSPSRDTVAASEPAPVATTPTAPVAAPAVAAVGENPAPVQVALPAEAVVPSVVAPDVTEKLAVAEKPVTETAPVVVAVPVAAAKAVDNPEEKPAPVVAAKPVENPVETPAPVVVEEKPVVGDTEVALCRLGLEKKQSRSINEVCVAALSADKSLASPLLKWTRGEFERGRTSVASAWASRIIAVDPEQADAYVIIGVAEQTAKRIPSARTAYKRYLELAPRGAFARDVRSALATM